MDLNKSIFAGIAISTLEGILVIILFALLFPSQWSDAKSLFIELQKIPFSLPWIFPYKHVLGVFFIPILVGCIGGTTAYLIAPGSQKKILVLTSIFCLALEIGLALSLLWFWTAVQ